MPICATGPPHASTPKCRKRRNNAGSDSRGAAGSPAGSAAEVADTSAVCRGHRAPQSTHRMRVRFDAVAVRLRTARARGDADHLAPRARDQQHSCMRATGESRVACVGVFVASLSIAGESARAQQWRQLSGWSDQFAAGTFDPRRNRFVDFGVFDGVVREWTGVACNAIERAAPAALFGRDDYSTVYDSRRGRIYVFAGPA